MKLFFFICLLFFVNTTIHSQAISLDKMIELRTKDFTFVEEFLLEKNWTFIGIDEPEGKRKSAGFAFNKNSNNDNADLFFRQFYGDENKSNRINLQVNLTTVYKSLINRIKTLNFKFLKSNIENGEVIKVYKKNNTIIEVTSATNNENGKTIPFYSFFVCDYEDYKLNFSQYL